MLTGFKNVVIICIATPEVVSVYSLEKPARVHMSFMKTVGLYIRKLFGIIMNWFSNFNILIKICM